MGDNIINYFDSSFSNSFHFEGIIEANYFMGRIKKNQLKSSNISMDGNKLFKNIYSNQILKNLKVNSDNELKNSLSNLSQGFIYCFYEKNNGIKAFIDKFAREKISRL